jgi:hypothetical protein
MPTETGIYAVHLNDNQADLYRILDEMTEATHLKKGDALEDAVRAIETAILRSFPGYSESTFRIEGKKILVAAGVRHEIDIYVSASLGPGYDAVFIFECKNWQAKVSKNEIIVFAEKVKVSNAQRGFFVAKSFTADAEAQAAIDPRLELLLAAELDPSAVMLPAGFHGIQVGETKANVNIRGVNATPESVAVPVDFDSALFLLGGADTSLRDYVTDWINQARKDRCGHFPSAGAIEGMHLLEFNDERTFEGGQAVINSCPVKSMELTGTVQVHVAKAVVVSAFEVATRGRFITVQIDMPVGQLKAELVQLPARADPST